MPTLERAIAIAAEAHAGAIDKVGAPYILHPLRLMMKMTTLRGMTVAVLHDVVEDNVLWTLQRLEKEGFDRETVAAVDALTRRRGESYPRYIERVAKNGLARAVKMHDLTDNIDIRRIPEPSEDDKRRIAKYERARRKLKAIPEEAA
jgi:(p)ppGpp synthase/HD superfamily hydrolase